MRRNLMVAVAVVALTVAGALATTSTSAGSTPNPSTTTTTTTIVAGPKLPPSTAAAKAAYAARVRAFAAAYHRWQVKRYTDAVLWSRLVAHVRAERAREAARRAAAASRHGACGGDLPPCWVMMRESGGNIRAENPTSSASGKWQALDSTWNGWGGYGHAAWAPEKVQDDFARWLWNHGRGCSHWSAC